MIGYKAFDRDLCCRGFQFEVGKTYTKKTRKEELRCCTDKVFHFCREVQFLELESDYKLSDSRLCEIVANTKKRLDLLGIKQARMNINSFLNCLIGTAKYSKKSLA